jgi:hypothetical protein
MIYKKLKSDFNVTGKKERPDWYRNKVKNWLRIFSKHSATLFQILILHFIFPGDGGWDWF